MQKLEDMGTGCPPDKVDVALVDAMFVLHTMQNIPTTFGAISCILLKQLCKLFVRVDFVCDSYVIPSIKEVERNRRCFAVTGPDQKHQNDWQHALQSFKISFFRFLADDWQYLSYSSIIKDHEFYLAYEETCAKLSEQEQVVSTEQILAYFCNRLVRRSIT